MNKRIVNFGLQVLRTVIQSVLPAASLGLLICFSLNASAQKVAILTPENTSQDIKFVEIFNKEISKQLKIVNSSLSETVFRSAEFENPFNLSMEESKHIGAAIGCDMFVLVKSASTRRELLDKPAYYESYAVIYLVSARTGRLIFWKLESRQSAISGEAVKLLFDSTVNLAGQISEKIKLIARTELTEKPPPEIEEIPDENTPESKNLRVPLPFRRIKPVYPPEAFFYNIKAVIEITVDIDADGKVLRTEINRWAGFGLDDSVTETVRKMNWRAAERNGKSLPMRVLLRYNFKKIEKEENQN